MTINLTKFSLTDWQWKPFFCRLSNGQFLLHWLNFGISTLQRNDKPLVYLAGPYSAKGAKNKREAERLETARFRAHTKQAAQLTQMGLIVFAPIVHSHPMKYIAGLKGSWDFWQHVDLTYIGLCSAMYVLCLPGWQDSVGLTAEIEYAEQLGLPIHYIIP